MPILPINSRRQFNGIFESPYEYILFIFYSPKNEKKFMREWGGKEQDLDKILRYLDRLSNSDKWIHVLFVEINVDLVPGFCTPCMWPNLFLYEGNNSHKPPNVMMSCNNPQQLRSLLSNAV